ncbi:hypothetical protein, partial [Burkholderia cenocepacia]|uniref:hypothetical protein n=1 Tax=Burkholderia cenocepacia TaxID=95486 RepID=UPI001F20CB84
PPPTLFPTPPPAPARALLWAGALCFVYPPLFSGAPGGAAPPPPTIALSSDEFDETPSPR